MVDINAIKLDICREWEVSGLDGLYDDYVDEVLLRVLKGIIYQSGDNPMGSSPSEALFYELSYVIDKLENDNNG